MKGKEVAVLFRDRPGKTGKFRRWNPAEGKFSITDLSTNRVLEFDLADVQYALCMEAGEVDPKSGRRLNVNLAEEAVKEGWVPPEGYFERLEEESEKRRKAEAKITHFAAHPGGDPDNLMSVCGLWAPGDEPHYKYVLLPLLPGESGAAVNCPRCLARIRQRNARNN